MAENIVKSFQTDKGIAYYDYNALVNKPDLRALNYKVYRAEYAQGGFENGIYTDKSTFCRVNKFALPYGGVIIADVPNEYIQIWTQSTLEQGGTQGPQITSGWFSGSRSFKVSAGIYAIAIVKDELLANRGDITPEEVTAIIKIKEFLSEEAAEADTTDDWADYPYQGQKLSFGNRMKHKMICQSVDFPNGLPSKTQQGMDIYDGNMYLLTNAGGCAIYNLAQNKVLGGYTLPNANANHHANSAGFAGTKDGLPLMYVSECYGNHACFVYTMGLNAATLVQTVTYDNADGEYYHATWRSACDWIVDKAANKLMTYGLLEDSRHKIKVFNLPSLDSANVVLTAEDILDEWVVEDYMNGSMVELYQGNSAYEDKIFLVDSTKTYNQTGGFIWVFNRENHELLTTIPTPFIKTELEDCCIYNGKLYTASAGGRLDCIDFNI